MPSFRYSEKTCGCGCGEKFFPKEDIRQVYLDHTHQRRAARKRRESRIRAKERTQRLNAIRGIHMTNLRCDRKIDFYGLRIRCEEVDLAGHKVHTGIIPDEFAKIRIFWEWTRLGMDIWMVPSVWSGK